MKRVLTGLVLTAVVLALVFLPARLQFFFVAATALVSALSAWEYMSLARIAGKGAPRMATVVCSLALSFVWWQWPDAAAGMAFYGVIAAALFLYCVFSGPVESVLGGAASAVFCLFYTTMTMVTIPVLREQPNGPSLVLLLLCCVWAGDIAAFYAGSALGRHKLAPRISPGKSWEGAIASVLGSATVAVLLVLFSAMLQRRDIVVLSYPQSLGYWIAVAVAVNIAAQLGDLAESALKRSAGVKDSGSLLPGHGGMLDRIDGLLLAAPVFWCIQILSQKF